MKYLLTIAYIFITAFVPFAIADSELKISFILDAEDSNENRALATAASKKAIDEGICRSVESVIVSGKYKQYSVYCTGWKITKKAKTYDASELSDSWFVSTTEDRITGDVKKYATSPWVSSETPIRSPYTGTKSMLGVGKSNSHTWGYVNFTESITLHGGSYKDGKRTYVLRARVDDTPISITFTKHKSDAALIPVDHKQFIDLIKSSNTITLEVPVYRGSNAYFTYSLKKSAEMINSL